MNTNYTTTFDKEADFEEAFITLLKSCGWERDVIKYPTEAVLIKNWANILYNNNRDIDKLGNYPLTDTEMEQIIEQITTLRTPFALNSFINGGTVAIKRDNPDDKLHLGKEVSLHIYDRHEIAGGKSRYQIVQQPIFDAPSSLFPTRRGDVMLLINGMPVFHIELKKSGIPLSRACYQIENYSKLGIFTGLFSLVQIFIAMTPEDAVYYTNPGVDGKFNEDFYFHWANFDNVHIKNWYEFTQNLLYIPMAHQLIGFYTVADSKDGILKVLRSYQYYAVSAISNVVAQNKWDEKKQLGGYIWHTTGSGKTLTSFKAADLIAKSQDADKVVFLVDRKELDMQSFMHYQNFADDENDIQRTESTDILRGKLLSSSYSDTLIVTTIQKMSNIFEDGSLRMQKDIQKINDKRIVFIVDECHRDTFGDMMSKVKETFPNALFFGFSGTPIQEENAKKGCTSSDVFGNELHRYTIGDGISDGNVLRFDPHRVETFKEKDLRRQIALKKAKAKSTDEALADPLKSKIYYQYLNDVPMISIEREIPSSQYRTDEHIDAVVKRIVEEYDDRSRGKKFHSIFATSSISEAIAYFKRLKKAAPDLKVTVLVDPSDNNTPTSYEKMLGLADVIDDYNKTFDQTFSIPTYAKMKTDISLRLSHEEAYKGIEKTTEKQLDMLIVVNQMLTGFDSKWVNVLYLDKLMQQETIIQAFSRTNRIFGEDKPMGMICYYRYPHIMESNIAEAVSIYAGDKAFMVFVDKLEANLKVFNDTYLEIKYLFENEGIQDFMHLPEDIAVKKRFALLFNKMNKRFEMIKVQRFSWKKAAKGEFEVDITEEIYFILLQRYKELIVPSRDPSPEEPPYDISSYITEISTGKIDADYFNSRFEKYLKIKSLDGESQEKVDSALQEIYKSFAMLSEEEQKYANIFIKDVQMGNVMPEEGKTMKDYIVEYMRKAKDDQISRFSEQFGLDNSCLRKMMALHLNKNNINEFGRFDNLKKSADMQKVESYFEKITGKKLSKFEVNKRFDKLLREFILVNGFDL